jgi:hypothetical protein
MALAIIELGEGRHARRLELDLADNDSAGQIIEALRDHGYGPRPTQMLIVNGSRSCRVLVPAEEAAPTTIAGALELLLS